MIIGIGVDVVDLERFERVLTRTPAMRSRLFTDAEQLRDGEPRPVASLAARTMVGRNGLGEDFAGAAVFLAGRSSAYVTGQSVFVDGGLSVH